MAQIFIPRKPDVIEKRSIETSEAIKMGSVVEITSAGKVQKCDTTAKAVGIVDNMPQYITSEETTTVASGDMALVALFGVTFDTVCSGTFAAGSYLMVSDGKVTGTTTNTGIIALEAATTVGQQVQYVRL